MARHQLCIIIIIINTRLTLDTRTFSAVDSSLRDLTLNRPAHSSDITSDTPDDFRPFTPFSEQDIQHNEANKFNWGYDKFSSGPFHNFGIGDAVQTLCVDC